MMDLGWPSFRPPDPDDDDGPKPVTIDERWLSEYADYGLAEMRPYLARHNEFNSYLKQRPPTKGDAA